MTRYGCLNVMWCLLLTLVSNTIAHAGNVDHSSIQTIQDMRIEARVAKDKNLPLLILFSTEDCEFCDLIREDYLEPMQISGDYIDKVIIREIKANDYHYMRDFNGELIGADSFALRYRADLIPTVVIINADGQVLAEPLVGIVSRHYYDEQLNKTIEQSLRTLAKLNQSQTIK